MAEREEIIKMGNFSIKENSTYVVRDKRDMDAPTGYIQKGISKLPSKGVSESFQVGFKSKDGGRTGVWDTGFFEYSPCYRGMDSKEIKSIVLGLKKKILNPYRQVIGNQTAFEQDNEKFFLGLNFKVYSSKTYDTSNPEDLIELYFGLLTKQLTPKGSEGDTHYNDSSYVVVDISKDLKVNDERAINEFSAIGSFTGMLKADKERLHAILYYIGMNPAKDVENGPLIGMFSNYIKTSGEDKVTMFNKLVEESETEVGLEKLELYKALRDQFYKGGKVTKHSGIYFYEDFELGSDLKNAAANVAKTQKLNHVKKALLLLEDED